MSSPPTSSRIKFHLTVAEQIQLLKSRGMAIASDRDAENTLTRLGYYRMSGYFYPLRKTQPRGTAGRQDTFQDGTSLDLVANLYEFDRKLRLLVLDATERVEVAVRYDVAHRLGQRHRMAHEIPAQLEPKFCTEINKWTGKTSFQEWCERLEAVQKKAQKEDFVRHHNANYSGKMPIWVVTEVWDFGLLSKFFAGMRYRDQSYIARRYGLPEGKYLVSWLRAINFARNVSAHHSRLWNKNFADRPTIPPCPPHARLHHLLSDTQAQTRIYGTLCILRTMLLAIAPEDDWAQKLKALCEAFPHSPLIDLSAAGFPAGWSSMSLWK